jgi:NAD(P)-dependent dehydrogenase (short-subunit alcohol dehydrogenase family)
MRFSGQTALVTGAARGIGRATMQRLLNEGAEVLAVDLAEIDDARAKTLRVDLAEEDAPFRVAEETRRLFLRLDILVNNAGIGGSRALDRTDDETLDRILAIDLRAVLRLTRECLPLLARPGGRIVSVASVFGEVGYPGTAAYAVAKAGVAQFTRQLVADYAPQGLRINAVAPGIIRTDMTSTRLDSDADFRRAMVTATPARRWGSPEEVAAVIAFLASDDAAYVNGQVVAVDGGWLAARPGA